MSTWLDNALKSRRYRYAVSSDARKEDKEAANELRSPLLRLVVGGDLDHKDVASAAGNAQETVTRNKCHVA